MERDWTGLSHGWTAVEHFQASDNLKTGFEIEASGRDQAVRLEAGETAHARPLHKLDATDALRPTNMTDED